MRGHDELRPLTCQVVEPREDCELPLRREGGLGFVEQIQPAPSKTVREQRQERLAV